MKDAGEITPAGRPRRWCRIWRYARRAGLAALFVVMLIWLVFRAEVAWQPYPAAYDAPPPASTLIEDRNGHVLAAFAARDGQWYLPLGNDDLSPHLVQAIVAVEDRRFFLHDGVDWRATLAAAWQNLTHFRVVRGGSTLTMQLQRLRAPQRRTLAAKWEEAVRACQLENRYDKKTLLTLYLNRAPFGGNLVGAGAASWRYFGKSCRDLSLGQAALLAGLPQNPNRLRPDRHPLAAKGRRRHVLDCMLAEGVIDQNAFTQADAEPLDARWHSLPQDEGPLPAPAPADGALPFLVSTMRGSGGGRVVTSLDSLIQKQACGMAREHLNTFNASGVDSLAAVVIDTASGGVLASVSIGPNAGLDLARRPRSTGSVLKPFIYAAAFSAGICGPQSILDDSPSAWPGYVPENFDREFRGKITAAQALSESRNIPALQLLSRVGVVRAAGVMGEYGLKTLDRTPERYGLSMAIGGAEATPMEVAQAYAAFARESAASATRVLQPRACRQTLLALAGRERTAHLSRDAARLDAAWKTGTSSGHRDAWCAAVTPRRTVVVWLGNSNGSGSKALAGLDAAAPLGLRLIAAIDPGGAAWLPAADDDGGSNPIVLLPDRFVPCPALTIISPMQGQQFIQFPDVPSERQKIHLKALGGNPIGERWWFVDGQLIGRASAQNGLWWPLAPGGHQAKVVDADGHAVTVSFTCQSQ